jgi:hypothetical protein
MEELPDQWKESIIVPIHKMGNKYCGISLLSTSYKNVFQYPFLKELLGIISVGFNITDQLLIRYFDLSDTAENIGAQ